MGKVFERVVIVMLENAVRSKVLENTYMNDLRHQGVFLTNSYGVTHSSQPHYIASIGGDTFGLFNDTPGYAHWIYELVPPVTTVVDLLEAAGMSWKAYAEDLTDANKPLTPANPPFDDPPADVFPFARKHVPFLSFPSITSVPERLAKIVNADQFALDLAAGELPHFSWYTPNLINDGHSLAETGNRIDALSSDRSLNIDNIATFLQGFLGEDPIAMFPPETLIVITFDEAYPYYDPYEIYTLLIGDMLAAGTSRFEPYNHYSLLRTVEDNFGLGSLKRNDAAAAPYWFLGQG